MLLAAMKETHAPAQRPNNHKHTQERLAKANSRLVVDLLLKAGMLSPADSLQLTEIARRLNKSLDVVLLSSAYLHRGWREDVCRAAHFVDSGLLDESTAVAGLEIAMTEGITFEDGLNKHMGWGH